MFLATGMSQPPMNGAVAHVTKLHEITFLAFVLATSKNVNTLLYPRKRGLRFSPSPVGLKSYTAEDWSSQALSRIGIGVAGPQARITHQ